jgi:hypothetical protein
MARRLSGQKKDPITLDTPIPEAPANPIDEPREADLERQLDELDSLIQVLKDNVEETRGTIRSNRMSSINELKNPAIREAVTALRNDI